MASPPHVDLDRAVAATSTAIAAFPSLGKGQADDHPQVEPRKKELLRELRDAFDGLVRALPADREGRSRGLEEVAALIGCKQPNPDAWPLLPAADLEQSLTVVSSLLGWAEAVRPGASSAETFDRRWLAIGLGCQALRASAGNVETARSLMVDDGPHQKAVVSMINAGELAEAQAHVTVGQRGPTLTGASGGDGGAPEAGGPPLKGPEDLVDAGGVLRDVQLATTVEVRWGEFTDLTDTAVVLTYEDQRDTTGIGLDATMEIPLARIPEVLRPRVRIGAWCALTYVQDPDSRELRASMEIVDPPAPLAEDDPRAIANRKLLEEG